MRGDFHIIKALRVRFLSTGDSKAQTMKILLSLITNQHHDEEDRTLWKVAVVLVVQ